jgi:hypothetical protein
VRNKKGKAKSFEIGFNGVDVDGDPKNDQDTYKLEKVDLTFEGPYVASKSDYVVHPIDRVFLPGSALGALRKLRTKNLGAGAGAAEDKTVTSSVNTVLP